MKQLQCATPWKFVIPYASISSQLYATLMNHLCQVENGIVKSWDDMEHLWNYTFFEKLVVRKLYPIDYNNPCNCS